LIVVACVLFAVIFVRANPVVSECQSFGAMGLAWIAGVIAFALGPLGRMEMREHVAQRQEATVHIETGALVRGNHERMAIVRRIRTLLVYSLRILAGLCLGDHRSSPVIS
jgi:hypothetical protein